MGFSILKKDLFESLQKTFPIIPLKSSLQILSNFRIIFSDSQLEIIATDLDQSMRVIAKAEGNDSFDLTVNARKLFEIVRELPDGIISFSIEENVLIIDTEKNFSCKIAGTDSHDFPGFPDISSGVAFEINPNILKNIIPKSSFAVSKDESRACLSGVLWEIFNDKTGMVATDGHRLGCSFVNEPFSVEEKSSCIISPKSMHHLLRIMDVKNDEKIKVVVNDKYITFSTSFFTLCSKQIEGPYPDYNKVVPVNNPKEAIIDRQTLLNAVKRVSVLSNQKTHLVKFTFDKDNLEVAVVNRDIGGEAQEQFEISYNGDQHSIGFNSVYFTEILDIIKTPKILLKMNTQISACLIFPQYEKEEEKISEDLFLIMPLRIMDA